MRINGEILLAIGRTWDDPRQFPPTWFRSRTAYSFHEPLREAIASEYGGAPLFVIKDPRICRLAPLYLDVLDALGIRSNVILPVRHPEDVRPAIEEFLRSRHRHHQIETDPSDLGHLSTRVWNHRASAAEDAFTSCRGFALESLAVRGRAAFRVATYPCSSNNLNR
jgi:hypothetical protein